MGTPVEPAAASSGYNPLFDRFVSRDRAEVDVLPGMVAYCLYKIAKREWATDFVQRHARKPNETELDEYVRTWTGTRIIAIERQALAVLQTFGGSAIDENTPRIREEALRGTFWASVWSSVVATFLYTLALVGIVIILRFAGIDILSILESARPGTG